MRVMTAEELIEALSEAPDNAQVTMWDSEAGTYIPVIFVEFDTTRETVCLS